MPKRIPNTPGRVRWATMALLLPLGSTPLWAQDAQPENPAALKLSGFATMAATYNDNSDAGTIFSYSQLNPANKGWSGNLDSVAGVQADLQLLPGTSVTVQGAVRAGENADPKLRLAYVRQATSTETAVRVGRLRSPVFFDSDVAEIGYAYLLSRPPIPLYTTMNSVNYLDGADLQWRFNLGNVSFLTQGYYGNNQYKHRFYNLSPVVAADAQVRDMTGLAVSASFPNLTLRVSHTETSAYTMKSSSIDTMNSGLTQIAGGLQTTATAIQGGLPARAAELRAQAVNVNRFVNAYNFKPTYTSVGFDANLDAWRFVGEWTRLNTNGRLTGNFEGQQLTIGYNVGEFTPYVSFARQVRTSPDVDTSAFATTGFDATLDGSLTTMKNALDQAARYADLSTRSISLGMRWDFRENMAMKVQYDRLDSPTANTGGYFTVSNLPFNNTVNLLTVSLDLIF